MVSHGKPRFAIETHYMLRISIGSAIDFADVSKVLPQSNMQDYKYTIGNSRVEFSRSERFLILSSLP